MRVAHVLGATLAWCVMCTGTFSTNAQAQVTPQEHIHSFAAHIVVATDNSIAVRETIVYNTGPLQERRGIFRDIRLTSSTGHQMAIGSISVVDEVGAPHPFVVLDEGEQVRIRIGNEHLPFLGERTYVIEYTLTEAIAQYEHLDELYWNVTGTMWSMPIMEVHVVVSLPEGAVPLQYACYWGVVGSNALCNTPPIINEHAIAFEVTTPLSSGEGVTVAVGFPKGIVTPYATTDTVRDFFIRHAVALFFIAGALCLLAFSLRTWWIIGRDARKTNAIVPQYDVPAGLTPLESATIVYHRIKPEHISAEIISLAIRGFLNIQKKENNMSAFSRYDARAYELVRQDKDMSSLESFDRALLDKLFTGTGNTVSLSKLKEQFNNDLDGITHNTWEVLKAKGYFKNISMQSPVTVLFVTLLIGSCISMAFDVSPITLVIVMVAFGIHSLLLTFYPSLSLDGVAIKEHLLGLKRYLMIAESDRLAFHNAPEKTPERFDTLLPFAMVFGVADAWAKEFEDIYHTQPPWYSGDGNRGAIAFTHALNSFAENAAGALSSSTPSSSGGSGGGGSSGGGGGGGGGGSW